MGAIERSKTDSSANGRQDIEPAATTAEKAGTSVAERVKAWGDAAGAILKPLSLLLAIVVVVAVAGTAVWRDQGTRRILVDVSPDTEKALLALGSDFDVRQALIDALNERIRGVQQVLTLQGLGQVIDETDPDAISFKPFGLDLSTNDITHMVREVLGTPPPTEVQIDLMCTPAPCRRGGGSKASLVVRVSAAEGNRRFSYPVPIATRALRRGLHQAMEDSANLLLEQAEPLLASVFYLNKPYGEPFEDERRRDWARAEGLALAVRSANDNYKSCVADLVIGGTLINRGLFVDGITAETRAAHSSNPTCQVHAETNIVFMLAGYAICAALPPIRKEADDWTQQAGKQLATLKPRIAGDLVRYRIPAAQLSLELVRTLNDMGDENAREAVRQTLCSASQSYLTTLTTPAAVRDGLIQPIATTLAHVRDQLPPNASLQYEHSLLDELRQLLEAGVPRADVLSRYTTASRLYDTVDEYALKEKHPRYLFVLEGQLATDMAWAAHDAQALRGEEARVFKKSVGDPQATFAENLAAARVAFENAIVTDTAAPMIEPSSDIIPLILLGDTLYASGDSPNARDAYARAVDAFIKDDEPADEIHELAVAVANWGSIRKINGDCERGAPPDQAWEERWTRLGGGPHDICALRHSKARVNRPALFEIIQPLITDTITWCPRAFNKATQDRLSDRDVRVRVINCQRSTRPTSWIELYDFVTTNTGAKLDAEIENALSTGS